MPTLFALAALWAAFLLFLIEPMAARLVLPGLGGSPSVWNTCMVFYQSALLAGYALAHLASVRLGPRGRAIGPIVLLGIGLAALPLPPPTGAEAATAPALWLLGWLARGVGVPFLAVAATAPTLQLWYAGSRRPDARDPYFLFAAGNLGSLLALACYPILVEPNVPLAEQGRLWARGYLGLGLLVLACAGVAWRSAERGEPVPAGVSRTAPRDWLGWLGLAFVPSSLMLGVTSYVTTDLAPVPLLWVVPLALYLLSFVLVFARRPLVPRGVAVRLLPFGVMLLTLLMTAGLARPVWALGHLATFFLAALVCHEVLAARRPEPERLTSYYLALALGGALGGTFNALVAPSIFDRIVEYPLALVLACLALPGAFLRSARDWRDAAILPLAIFGLMAVLVRDTGSLAETVPGMAGVVLASGLSVYVAVTHRRRPARFALGVGAVLLAGGLSEGVDGRVLLRERDFFGAIRVTEAESDAGRFHRLFHGRTIHGQQNLAPEHRSEPLTYYHTSGPFGRIAESFHSGKAPGRVAIVGLGTGSLASYARPGESWAFFEIDPAIVAIARDPRFFTYWRDSRAGALGVVVGDARVRFRSVPDGGFGLIVLDAFSSDAIPTHLLTREAARLYRKKLAGGGLIALHLSNRYLDLAPVIDTLARETGMVGRVRLDLDTTAAEGRAGRLPSLWGVLAAEEADLGPIARDPRWHAPPPGPEPSAWSDDHTDVLGRLKLGR